MNYNPTHLPSRVTQRQAGDYLKLGTTQLQQGGITTHCGGVDGAGAFGYKAQQVVWLQQVCAALRIGFRYQLYRQAIALRQLAVYLARLLRRAYGGNNRNAIEFQ